MFKKIVIIGVLASALGIYLFKKSSQQVALKVGTWTFTEQEIEYRNKIIFYLESGDNRKLGRHQLREAALNAAVLMQNGHNITRETLLKEAARIDQTTLAPEKLQGVKNIFGDDYESYLKVYVMPVYANRVIYFDFFLRDQNVQKESLAKANLFLQNALSQGGDLKNVAEKNGLRSILAHFSLSDGLQKFEDERSDGPESQSSGAPAVVQQAMQKNEKLSLSDNSRWVDQIFKKLKPGQVFNQVIDVHEGWQVVKLIKQVSQDKYLIEVVDLPKEDFNSWFEREKLKLGNK